MPIIALNQSLNEPLTHCTSTQLQTDYLFALVFVATALGFAFFFLVSFLEWYFLHHWHESALGQEND
jgi:ABC-type nitrate/sulfonate/bicarbonate transport system permease component